MLDKDTLILIASVIIIGLLIPSNTWLVIGIFIFYIVMLIGFTIYGDGTNNTRPPHNTTAYKIPAPRWKTNTTSKNAPQQQRTYSTAPPAYRQKPPQPVSRTLKNHIIYYTCISVYTVIAYFLTLLLVNNIDPSERGFVFIFIIIFITIGAFLSSALKHHFARQ